ncbi:zwei Ig domain protein zig-8 [Sergentomyia squamirostris]
MLPDSVGQCLILLMLLLHTDAIATNSRLGDDMEPHTGPYLSDHGITNVTTQVGTHAYLPCKVKQLGNKSVSWVRVRDDHILTVDRTVFIADERFQSYYVESTGIWTLQIKYVQARDAGVYECQVSTEPKISSQVHLNVVVPRTELVGDAVRYVKAGSKVILRCLVRGALEPPTYIMWFYGIQQIYQDNKRGWKIQMERDYLDPEIGNHTTVGSLIINQARKRDSGNYTCSPSNSEAITIMLHVINGEYSASAITSASSRSKYSDLIAAAIIISVAMFKT